MNSARACSQQLLANADPLSLSATATRQASALQWYRMTIITAVVHFYLFFCPRIFSSSQYLTCYSFLSPCARPSVHSCNHTHWKQSLPVAHEAVVEMRTLEPHLQKLEDMQFTVATGGDVDIPKLQQILKDAAPAFQRLIKIDQELQESCMASFRSWNLYSKLPFPVESY